MQQREFNCVVTNAGHLPGKERLAIADLLRLLAGKRIRIKISVVDKPRTLKQSKFYQGPFIEAFQKCLLDCGQRVDHDDIHDGLRDAYAKNGYSIPLPDGSFLKIPPSTRRLSTTTFEDYLEEIRAEYAHKFNWQLPLPNEVPIDAYEN